MSKQRSWCCGFIPSFWWWFLTLLGLPLLFLLMTYFRQGAIESDLTNRVSNALSAENIDWVDVDVHHRGRDVMLRGVSPNDSDRDRALGIAAGIEGVHRVDFEGGDPSLTAVGAEIEPELIMPTLMMAAQGGKLTVEGSLPSQQDIDNVINAADARFGAGNVDNQLTVGAGVATPEWLAAPDDLLNIMPDKDAILNIADGNAEIATQVNSDNVREDMLSRAKTLLGGDIIDNIVVKPLPSPEVAMALSNGKLRLSGKVSSRQQSDALVNAAADRVGAVNVDNQLKVDDGYADAVWLDSAGQVMGGLLVENGSAVIVNDTVELKAEVESDAARSELIAKNNATLRDSGLILVNNITVAAKPESAAATTTSATQDEQVTDGGGDGNAATTAEAAQACQVKLDAAAKDKKILFRVNRADIRNESYALLDELAGILTGCKDNLAGKTVAIGGHTDSDGSESYNLGLSQRRAEAVRTYLTGKGVTADLMNAKGFGESQPVASNSTAAGKAQNRRISFDIKAAGQE